MKAPGREVLFEVVRIGIHAKVTAIDPITGIEATVLGPARASESELKTLAVRKLALALTKAGKG